MAKTINLAKDKKCYSNKLLMKFEKLNKIYEDETVSVDDYRKAILKVIESAEYNKYAKPNFIKNLNEMTTKDQMSLYIWNCIRCAMNFDPRKRKNY